MNPTLLIKVWEEPIANEADNTFLDDIHRIYGANHNHDRMDLGFYHKNKMIIDLDELVGLTIPQAVDSIMNTKKKATEMIDLLTGEE